MEGIEGSIDVEGIEGSISGSSSAEGIESCMGSKGSSSIEGSDGWVLRRPVSRAACHTKDFVSENTENPKNLETNKKIIVYVLAFF